MDSAWVIHSRFPAFLDSLQTLQREMPVFGMIHDHTVSGIIVSGNGDSECLIFNDHRMRFPLNV